MLNLKQFEQSLTRGAPVAPYHSGPGSISVRVFAACHLVSLLSLQLSPSKIKQKSFIDYQNDCLIFCQPTNHLND